MSVSVESSSPVKWLSASFEFIAVKRRGRDWGWYIKYGVGVGSQAVITLQRGGGCHGAAVLHQHEDDHSLYITSSKKIFLESFLRQLFTTQI
jgi:hypothetical protein